VHLNSIAGDCPTEAGCVPHLGVYTWSLLLVALYTTKMVARENTIHTMSIRQKDILADTKKGITHKPNSVTVYKKEKWRNGRGKEGQKNKTRGERAHI